MGEALGALAKDLGRKRERYRQAHPGSTWDSQGRSLDVPLLAGLEPGRVRERGLAASYSVIHSLIHSNSHSSSISCWELRTPSQKTEPGLGGSSSGEDSKIKKHLSPGPAHIRVWLSSGSRGPSQLASRNPGFTPALCLDRDSEGSLILPVNPGPNTAPRRHSINVHGLKR